LLNLINKHENQPTKATSERQGDEVIEATENNDQKPYYFIKLKAKADLLFVLEQELHKHPNKYKYKMGSGNNTKIKTYWFLREKRHFCEEALQALQKLDLNGNNGPAELGQILKSIEVNLRPLSDILIATQNTNHYAYAHTQKTMKHLQSASSYHHTFIRKNNPSSVSQLKGQALPKLKSSLQALHNALSGLEQSTTEFSIN